MPRFVCTHHTTALQKFVLPNGRFLAFDYNGVLDTDEEGAAVVRANPLYGCLILEMDQCAPAHGKVPVFETPRKLVLDEAKERQKSRIASVTNHAQAIRAQIEAAEAARRQELTPAAQWLLEELRSAGGEVAAAPTIARAAATGFSNKQLRAARESLPVASVKRGWNGGWAWALLDQEGILAN